MTNKPVTDQSPGTPTRVAKKASGGGAKKLQQLLGASESDIDLLLRPAEIVSTQTHRVSVVLQFKILLTAFRWINWYWRGVIPAMD